MRSAKGDRIPLALALGFSGERNPCGGRICQSGACQVMTILFTGVSFQTYFPAPCAREVSGRARGIWASVLLPSSASFFFLASRAARLPPASSPLFTLWGSRPPPFSSSWRWGAVLPPRPCVDSLWELGGPPADRSRPRRSLVGPATGSGLAAAAAAASPPEAAEATATAIVPQC